MFFGRNSVEERSSAEGMTAVIESSSRSLIGRILGPITAIRVLLTV